MTGEREAEEEVCSGCRWLTDCFGGLRLILSFKSQQNRMYTCTLNVSSSGAGQAVRARGMLQPGIGGQRDFYLRLCYPEHTHTHTYAFTCTHAHTHTQTHILLNIKIYCSLQKSVHKCNTGIYEKEREYINSISSPSPHCSFTSCRSLL